MASQRLMLSISRHVFYLMWCVILTRSFGKSEEAVPCGNLKDMFPNTEPQPSPAPYTLNISDQYGSFADYAWRYPGYYGPESLHTVRLRGLNTMNGTETNFTGFVISAKNEFADEESGYFVAPFPSGVSKMECKDGTTSQLIEEVKNSTSSKVWSTVEVKWKAPKKYPAGKITISASVVKDPGVYWEGVNVTLHYVCSGPKCANSCPQGNAKTKFGCATCTCAGGVGITGSPYVLLWVFVLIYFFI